MSSRPAGFGWNYDRSEIVADGIVHAIGLSLGLVGAVFLLFVAHLARGGAVTPVAVYAAGLLAALGFSAKGLRSLPGAHQRQGRARRRLREEERDRGPLLRELGVIGGPSRLVVAGDRG